MWYVMGFCLIVSNVLIARSPITEVIGGLVNRCPIYSNNQIGVTLN